VLSAFDCGEFVYERFQDELLHKMGQLLGQDYNNLKLDVLDPDRPSSSARVPSTTPVSELSQTSKVVLPEVTHTQSVAEPAGEQAYPTESLVQPDQPQLNLLQHQQSERIASNTISPISGATARTHAIKVQLAQATGETIPTFEQSCLESIPIQAGGVHPVADLWYSLCWNNRRHS